MIAVGVTAPVWCQVVDWSTIIASLGGAVIGGAIGSATQWFTSRTNRKHQVEDGRNAYLRGHLERIAELITDFMYNATEVHFWQKAIRERQADAEVPANVSAAMHETSRQLWHPTGLILDPDLQGAIMLTVADVTDAAQQGRPDFSELRRRLTWLRAIIADRLGQAHGLAAGSIVGSVPEELDLGNLRIDITQEASRTNKPRSTADRAERPWGRALLP